MKDLSRWRGKKTNPIQTQSKPVLSAVEWANFQKAKMNVNLTLTKDYRKKNCLAPKKQTQFKPNFKRGVHSWTAEIAKNI